MMTMTTMNLSPGTLIMEKRKSMMTTTTRIMRRRTRKTNMIGPTPVMRKTSNMACGMTETADMTATSGMIATADMIPIGADTSRVVAGMSRVGTGMSQVVADMNPVVAEIKIGAVADPGAVRVKVAAAGVLPRWTVTRFGGSPAKVAAPIMRTGAGRVMTRPAVVVDDAAVPATGAVRPAAAARATAATPATATVPAATTVQVTEAVPTTVQTHIPVRSVIRMVSSRAGADVRDTAAAVMQGLIDRQVTQNYIKHEAIINSFGARTNKDRRQLRVRA